MIGAIIQARVNSSRLYNKIFAEIEGKSLIWHVCNRLGYSKLVDKIVVATTTNSKDDLLEEWCRKNEVSCFRGNENNVLKRYYDTANNFKFKHIVRITADDPLKDPNIIDQVIKEYLTGNLDFAFNNFPPSFPEGMDVEIFSYDALKSAFEKSESDFEREHVTQYLFRNIDKFRYKNITNICDQSHLRWTIDTQTDLEMVRQIYSRLFSENKMFYMSDIISLLEDYPDISALNLSVERSEMYKSKKV